MWGNVPLTHSGKVNPASPENEFIIYFLRDFFPLFASVQWKCICVLFVRNLTTQFLGTFIPVSCMTLIQWLMFSASAHTTQLVNFGRGKE